MSRWTLVLLIGCANLANLTLAMDDVQFAADVRRTVPLVLRLQRLGGVPILTGLVRALSRAVLDPSS